MKKKFVILLICAVCLVLLGCKDQEKGADNMEKYDIHDFYYIDKAPETDADKDLDQVEKMLYSENDSSVHHTVAIDVKNNEIYVNPRWSSLGIRAKDGTKEIDDAESVLQIIEKYNVQEWKKDYTTDDPDSYEDGWSWNLWLQFKDGSVEKHEGNDEDYVPENLDDVKNELDRFVGEKLNND